ncbi:EF-hand domain-containing protein [Euryhalocaulis caribicus]|uniref:EF-hand domain-containing protein n=1 Tax=Euryhalocaulis caribicus TaxID=1161401 RepID=UPI00039A34BA|nr:EF-hand domain-containing protein [Euryhalocaulis caribicus]
MKKTLIITTAALFAASAAMAGNPGDKEDKFAAADTDGNGALSWEEVAAAKEDATEADFAEADTDGSGDLSKDEVDAWHAAHDAEKMDDGMEDHDMSDDSEAE